MEKVIREDEINSLNAYYTNWMVSPSNEKYQRCKCGLPLG